MKETWTQRANNVESLLETVFENKKLMQAKDDLERTLKEA